MQVSDYDNPDVYTMYLLVVHGAGTLSETLVPCTAVLHIQEVAEDPACHWAYSELYCVSSKLSSPVQNMSCRCVTCTDD